jgi:stage II sporulation protein AA (anti-sigma F factor antagonist)
MTVDQPTVDEPAATGDFSIVRLPDEIDLSVGSEVLDLLLSTINRAGPHLVVDARDVRFMDSSGLNALVRARDRAEAMGGSVHLVAAGRRLRRLLEITRLERTLHRVDTLDAALACLSDGSGGHVCDPP